MNTIIIGNITQDIDIKYFESGKIKARFSVATNIYNPETKEKEPHFFDCEVWEKTAEYIGENYKKGDRIAVECVHKHETYEKDGQTKEKEVFVVRNLIFTGAYSVVSGVVERQEVRQKNDKTIQYLKLKDCEATIINKTKDLCTKGREYTIFGQLITNEKN